MRHVETLRTPTAMRSDRQYAAPTQNGSTRGAAAAVGLAEREGAAGAGRREKLNRRYAA